MKKKLRFLLPVALLLGLLLSGCSTKAPEYNAKKPLGPQINYTITGIDAGAGIMATTQKALTEYGLTKDNWQLQTSSTAAMTSTLDKAIRHHEPIVITGWQPHWMFTKYPIKFLKDPKHVYGKSENIHTIVRKGLKQDKPEAYEMLDRFHWTPTEMSQVMIQVNNGKDPERAAKEWIQAHPDQVKSWTKGIKKVSGHPTLKMTYVAWDSEIASTNVVAEVLRGLGYKVTIQAMEMQPMWASIATNVADAQVAAWLPTTSAKYYHDYQGKFVDLGTNLKGARVGLAVPKYMTNINSIEDLKNNE
ncbi:glycine/betaine ABC transporter [Levilactobacillus bambusae]|uniref:Glycine/betaine ABC transporter n=2 Tax=Levilactobacillus bambusae TaxID=2024736 RepID=A0A2V1MZZ9_9LACO|nr:glycine betaine ABC transporter substrate-binding protein [Levilactobacillus bambusae]PWG00392.1 glycine/betaine ABC transporter [Levilactobacillus bambusae]